MAVTDDSELDQDKTITFRVTERFKRNVGMRAEQLGMDKSEYLRYIVKQDLDDVEFPDPE